MNRKTIIDTLLYILTYITCLMFIFSCSYYAALSTMNILPFTRYLLKISSTEITNNTSQAVRNLLITRIISSMPERRFVNSFFLPASIVILFLRRSVPFVNHAFHGLGNLWNMLLNRNVNQAPINDNIADVTLLQFPG
uniref:Uncharacterized protein n=1 Tax=Gracilaria robusta TaxID=38400 RepID=O46324_9FLOR|nr:ORF3 [Gracilaria robusta]